MYALIQIYKNADLESNERVGSMICPSCGKEFGIMGDQLRGPTSVACPHCSAFHVFFQGWREIDPFHYVVKWNDGWVCS